MAKAKYSGPSDFSKDEFTDMELNPFAVPRGGFIFNYYDIFRKGAQFQHIPRKFKNYASWDNPDLDLLLRVIVIMVDSESPLAEESDFEYRKTQAIILTGADANDKVLKEIEDEGNFYSSLVYNFFKAISDMDYETWYSMKELYHSLCRQARMPMPRDADAGTINARAKLPQAIAAAEQELKAKQYILFKSKRLEKKIIAEAGKDDIGGYAEEYAEEPEWKQHINQGDDNEDYGEEEGSDEL